VHSVLCLLQKIPIFSDLESEILNLKSRAESISKQLGAWIHTLRVSGLKGQRYVREKTRQANEAVRDRGEFLKGPERVRTSGAAKA
jgi:hypothetical protein